MQLAFQSSMHSVTSNLAELSAWRLHVCLSVSVCVLACVILFLCSVLEGVCTFVFLYAYAFCQKFMYLYVWLYLRVPTSLSAIQSLCLSL